MPRKPVELDKEQFEKLCELQCTQKEICSWFDITDKTLTRWCKRTYGMGFSDVFEIKRGKGKIALRRYQFQQAKTSASMAIWLGKQWLGQTDQMKVQTQAIPVVIEDDLTE
nr:MAG TPA: Putative ATPase subunit of terminase (gpP-like) [Caudoviricetes sp.]